ncbi:MarR family transcriptional regulator [Bacillus sp. DNRA2]|uniref:MarR family winged helix-turn-helix transcriptional regulator n=1 Tax=Bacillus sp. DNRA2 TaxID=2723053 RepID=UPI00145CE486|nr:MarR family transcriptional regulator [Bacillus sp. DNRA2]NMD70684.1 MarR family transcriptional regulator [Bacillus sp. DNRA2]
MEFDDKVKLGIIVDVEKESRYICDIIKQKGREILHNYSITPPQFAAMQWLFEAGEMTIGELSGRMFLACSTTTDLVDRLEKNQFVQRIKDENDRRVVRIHLLDSGKKIMNEILEQRQQYMRQVLINFTYDEIETLKKLMTKFHQGMLEE